MKKALLLLLPAAAAAATLDLSKAVVVHPAGFSGPEKRAVAALVEEVEKRTQIRWPVATSRPAGAVAVVSMARASGAAEGYRLRVENGSISITGNDARGVLFGAGHLLRKLRMNPGSLTVDDDLSVATAPKYSLRGHQLGYRPKTNSYDGWTLAMWDQYIRELALFGANAIELIPPRSDDDASSPHFPLPPMDTMIGMSRILDDYGLDVWIWYPAMDKDYSDPKTVESALAEWAEVFRKLPRVDHVFVPGGDPGHTQPKHLMALLEKQTQSLRRYHPKAQMWVSPQSFSEEWMEEFYGILRNEQPAWLAGVVFGPQQRVSLARLKASIPARYRIRHYPDITHSVRCQYPVPDWDRAFALTAGREGINPRPMSQAAIFRLLQPLTMGFLTYSEGSNDDVNKFIWSGLGWDPEARVIDILRDYSRLFIGDRYADTFAQGLLALERNWQGPLLANDGVYSTLQQFQAMERSAAPLDLLNWRFQQALYRAYYDAYTRSRLIHETSLENQAMDVLRNAAKAGSLAAMSRAERILDRALAERVSEGWRARVFELAEALFQSNRMQLSVARYKAIALDRGANLDNIDTPLNESAWLKARFADLRRLDAEDQRLNGIDQIVRWTDPGPGGFYDDLGNPSRQPHLVRGAVSQGFEKDPAFLESSLVGFAYRGPGRLAWFDHAEGLNDAPLEMRYTSLDASAQYTLRVVYAGDRSATKVRLDADGKIEVHPLMEKPFPPRPLEFLIPREATADGELMLSWRRQPGAGGNGRGHQVGEVWLLRR